MRDESNKKAFVTLLSTEDYLEAVLILNRSLKSVNSKYPLVCGVVSTLKDNRDIIDILEKENIIVEIIDKLNYCNETKTFSDKKFGNNFYILNTASKISLFDLKNYSKLVYIDSDSLVIKNIDDTMDFLDGSMVVSKIKDEKDLSKSKDLDSSVTLDSPGFTGMFTFAPRNHRTDYYRCLIENINCFDGDLFANLWFFNKSSVQHKIPYNYFTDYDIYEYNYDVLHTNYQDKIKAIHFCGDNKPWKDIEFFKEKKDPLILLYNKYIISLYQDYPNLKELKEIKNIKEEERMPNNLNKLIFKKEKTPLAEIFLEDFIDINSYDLKIVFGESKVKEINFLNSIKNSDEAKLNPLYKKILSINYNEADEVEFFFSEGFYYTFHLPIKEIHYRVFNYSNSAHLELRESLSIRFIENNLFSLKEINDNKMIPVCNTEECPYFNKGNCTKYTQKLYLIKNSQTDYFICENCFLDLGFFPRKKLLLNDYQSALKEIL